MKQVITSSVMVLLVCVCLTAAFDCRAAGPEEVAGAANQALSPESLEILAAPYALYPDALVAQILPAATFPAEVTLASRWVHAHPNLAGLDARPWDPSVKAVARFPEVIKKMDDNLEATIALGDAFVNQQADLMDAIQRLRVKFRAYGSLVDTPQQKVVLDGNVIQIVPANPQVIYVPSYTPEVDFGEMGADFSAGPLTFGAGIAVGDWLNLGFDWHRHHCFFGHYGSYGEWGMNGGSMWSHPHFVPSHYNLDVQHMHNVTIHNAENIHNLNITNTNVHNARNVNTENISISRRAESPHEGGAGLSAYAHESTAQEHSERGQNSREATNLSATPHYVEHTAPIPEEYKAHATPTPPVYRSPEPAAFRVESGGAERAASARGAASQSSAGASSYGTSGGQGRGR